MRIFEFSDKEEQICEDWKSVHHENCPYLLEHAHELFKGIPTIGGQWEYTFLPTSIGVFKTVKCTYCGAKQELTDIESF